MAFFDPDKFIARLRAGLTPGMIIRGDNFPGEPKIERLGSYESYHAQCENFPEWSTEAKALAARNTAAARKRKGDHIGKRIRCNNGHSLLDPVNVRVTIDKEGFQRRRCLVCERSQVVGKLTPAEVRRETEAVKAGFSVTEITRGTDTQEAIVNFAKLRRHRVEHPEYDRFIIENARDANSRVKLLKFRIVPANAQFVYAAPAIIKPARKEIPPFLYQDGDLEWISSLIPRGFPQRDDVIQNIFMDLCARAIGRDDVPPRVKALKAEQERSEIRR
jgi:hypothetical protein